MERDGLHASTLSRWALRLPLDSPPSAVRSGSLRVRSTAVRLNQTPSRPSSWLASSHRAPMCLWTNVALGFCKINSDAKPEVFRGSFGPTSIQGRSVSEIQLGTPRGASLFHCPTASVLCYAVPGHLTKSQMLSRIRVRRIRLPTYQVSTPALTHTPSICSHPNSNLQPHRQLAAHENKEPLAICQRLLRSGDPNINRLTTLERLVEVEIE